MNSNVSNLNLYISNATGSPGNGSSEFIDTNIYNGFEKGTLIKIGAWENTNQKLPIKIPYLISNNIFFKDKEVKFYDSSNNEISCFKFSCCGLPLFRASTL